MSDEFLSVDDFIQPLCCVAVQKVARPEILVVIGVHRCPQAVASRVRLVVA